MCSVVNGCGIEYVDNISKFPNTDEVSTGTTILAMHYAGGVILAADSRTSSGQFVSNRVARKITKLLPNIYVARCGSAADTQNLSLILKYYGQVLRQQLRIFNYEPHGSNVYVRGMDVDPSHSESNTGNYQPNNPISTFSYSYKHDQECGFMGPTVNCIASIAQNLVHEYKDRLRCGLIFAGVDFTGIPDVYIVMPGGAKIKVDSFISAGSGSGYIQAFLQSNYKKDQSAEESVRLAKQAILYATKNDSMSGGLVRLVNIDTQSVQEYCFDVNTPMLN
ncbi:20S proteasome subunit beta 1 [Babesia microti strain RI]|uniref:Proteasome subunit beta n=1 Tax=Babesia microti (strain RI) TaxID=1133968 RepID=I7IGE2_BABMR|nr:20S proteasome subunit beta 1 [Babesia microti strain RI]CCF73706.1 20S proteasome subunit beta 1 [Babesia microti strain RI]|eukprot:XP_012648315.1 20S proteasome subunit beta 1 [Babesia microti strain RI]